MQFLADFRLRKVLTLIIKFEGSEFMLESVELRRKYDEGLIDKNEFIELLFNSEEIDRKRRRIVKENEKLLRKYGYL